jgi:phosphatidylserine/phosphatidylglycerophosphate/cardiolipin synthase-like enzyme
VVGSPLPYLPAGIADAEAELVRRIGAAKRRVQIQLLLYAPLSHDERSFYPTIDNALRAAAVRGVAVELLVSSWNTREPKIRWLKSLALVPGVQVRIVSLPPAPSGFIPYARVIHSKYMVVDSSTLWLGTSNWLGGYFDRSRNVEIVIHHAGLAQQAAAVHDQLWRSRHAEPIDVSREYTPPRVF